MYKILKINKHKLAALKPETAVQAINQQWRRSMKLAQTNDTQSYLEMILTQTINMAHEILFEVHNNDKEEEMDMDIIKQQHSCETISELIHLLDRKTDQLEANQSHPTQSTNTNNEINETMWDPNIKIRSEKTEEPNEEEDNKTIIQLKSQATHDNRTELETKQTKPTESTDTEVEITKATLDPNIKIKTEKTDEHNEEEDNKAPNPFKPQTISEFTHTPVHKIELEAKLTEPTKSTNPDKEITEATWDPNIKIKIEKTDEPSGGNDDLNKEASNLFKSQARDKIRTKIQLNRNTSQTTRNEQPSSSGYSKDTKKETSAMGQVQREPKITDHRIYKNSVRLKTLWPKWNNIHTWETLDKMRNYPKVLKEYLRELKRKHPRRLITLIKMYRDEDIFNQT